MSAEAPAICALRLALGREFIDAGSADWASVLEFAVRERLAGVAWLRSGQTIRKYAPREIVGRWRGVATGLHLQGEQRLTALGECLAALADAGIPTVVMKGMPLANRLYGDPFVRGSADIDLFIALDRRAEARSIASRLGWRCIGGEPPWDETFDHPDPQRGYLELHSTVVTDYLAHLHVPGPGSADVIIRGMRVPAHSDVLQPATLAAHLAGHQLPPMLWYLDFATLWNGIKDQRAARAAATDVGLLRYVSWAVEQSLEFARAVDGYSEALVHFGIRGQRRSDRHFSLLRHARLAASAPDALRVVAACTWPRPLRQGFRPFARDLGSRLRRRARLAQQRH
jgi:hypothetical protein